LPPLARHWVASMRWSVRRRSLKLGMPDDWQARHFAALAARHGALTAAIGSAALAGLAMPGAVCFLGSVWGLASSPDAGLAGGALAALGH